jgi:hypothetical protein
MAKKHKNLPIKDATKFALAFKEFSTKLLTRQDEKLKGREALPAWFLDLQVQPKLTFLPGRKRALTGQEATKQQEQDKSLARRRAGRLANSYAAGDNAIEEANILQS